jgi:hypothetical protein
MADFALTQAIRDGVLVVTFTGASNRSNAKEMTEGYFRIVLASGAKKVLADIRGLQGRLSEAETYFLLRDLPVKPVPEGIRTAIVESPANRTYAQFLEDTAANAGVHFRTFLDYDKAIAWVAAQ